MRLNNFRVSGSILTGLFPVDVPRGRGDNEGTIFTVPAPKICEGKKIVQNFSQFLTTYDFHREYLRNGSTHRTSKKNLINRNPFYVGRKKLGELWSTNKKVLEVHTESHPSGHFSGDYISANRGCCLLKLLYTLEIGQGYLAHTSSGTGVPQKNLS